MCVKVMCAKVMWCEDFNFVQCTRVPTRLGNLEILENEKVNFQVCKIPGKRKKMKMPLKNTGKFLKIHYGHGKSCLLHDLYTPTEFFTTNYRPGKSP